MAIRYDTMQAAGERGQQEGNRGQQGGCEGVGLQQVGVRAGSHDACVQDMFMQLSVVLHHEVPISRRLPAFPPVCA